jgi:recombinational DNA repair protein (RecF pathway)
MMQLMLQEGREAQAAERTGALVAAFLSAPAAPSLLCDQITEYLASLCPDQRCPIEAQLGCVGALLERAGALRAAGNGRGSGARDQGRDAQPTARRWWIKAGKASAGAGIATQRDAPCTPDLLHECAAQLLDSTLRPDLHAGERHFLRQRMLGRLLSPVLTSGHQQLQAALLRGLAALIQSSEQQQGQQEGDEGSSAGQALVQLLEAVAEQRQQLEPAARLAAVLAAEQCSPCGASLALLARMGLQLLLDSGCSTQQLGQLAACLVRLLERVGSAAAEHVLSEVPEVPAFLVGALQGWTATAERPSTQPGVQLANLLAALLLMHLSWHQQSTPAAAALRAVRQQAAGVLLDLALQVAAAERRGFQIERPHLWRVYRWFVRWEPLRQQLLSRAAAAGSAAQVSKRTLRVPWCCGMQSAITDLHYACQHSQ